MALFSRGGMFAAPFAGQQMMQPPMQQPMPQETAPGAVPNGIPVSPSPAVADPMKLSLLDKLGMAGGIISRNYGGQDGVTDTIQQRMQQAYAQRQYQQHLQDSQAQWLAEQEWQRAHPKPPELTEFERSVQAAGIQPGTTEYQTIMRNYAVNRSDPTQIVANGDGSFTPYRRSQISGAALAPAAPTKPVGKLTPIGGAPSRGGGTF
jgi:hypothetical protein